MRFAIILALVLGATWLSLSGYFIPLILTLGGLSILFVIWMCFRMAILDKETVPYLSSPLSVIYFFWLFKEIVKANVQVVKAVLSPDMEVSPTMIKVPSDPGTEIGKTMFGNSITLTPGTVTVEMSDDEILVHALLEEMSDPDGFAEMARRSARAIGEGKSSGGQV